MKFHFYTRDNAGGGIFYWGRWGKFVNNIGLGKIKFTGLAFAVEVINRVTYRNETEYFFADKPKRINSKNVPVQFKNYIKSNQWLLSVNEPNIWTRL